MKNLKLILSACFIASILFVSLGFTEDSIKCVLKGKVIDRPQSSRLLLVKQDENPQINAVSIPIHDGKFEYVLESGFEELYTFIFSEEFEQGRYLPVPFFLEPGVINFTLYPSERFNENKIEGGELNRKYSDYTGEISLKYSLLNPEKSVNEKVREQIDKDGWLNEKTLPLYYRIVREDSSYQEWLRWKIQYIGEHSDIVGYNILISEARWEKDKINDFSQYAELFQTVFEPKYPNHPYTEIMINLISGSLLKAGNPYNDFTALDLKGNRVRLSERITGKKAILHLWASWCGPCRKKGRELIPVYEEFRGKNFIIIGVAREKSMPDAETAMKKENYPWENLVELNDNEQIWNKYGIGNSGGSVFLIDEKGVIVAVNPSIDEIRNFLHY